MLEFEKTYLAKYIPTDLSSFSSEIIIDIYLPQNSLHPKLRIRKYGENHYITRKEPINKDDASVQKESTIIISEEEFNEMNKLEGKRIHKIRYRYPMDGYVAEFDVFLDRLEGLVLVDVEFEKVEEKVNFQIPEFCLVEVTHMEFVAGGVLAGKSYRDIDHLLNTFKYQKLSLK